MVGPALVALKKAKQLFSKTQMQYNDTAFDSRLAAWEQTEVEREKSEKVQLHALKPKFDKGAAELADEWYRTKSTGGPFEAAWEALNLAAQTWFKNRTIKQEAGLLDTKAAPKPKPIKDRTVAATLLVDQQGHIKLQKLFSDQDINSKPPKEQEDMRKMNSAFMNVANTWLQEQNPPYDRYKINDEGDFFNENGQKVDVDTDDGEEFLAGFQDNFANDMEQLGIKVELNVTKELQQEQAEAAAEMEEQEDFAPRPSMS